MITRYVKHMYIRTSLFFQFFYLLAAELQTSAEDFEHLHAMECLQQEGGDGAVRCLQAGPGEKEDSDIIMMSPRWHMMSCDVM